MRGARPSHFAITIFCWLPPDRPDIGVCGESVLMRRRSIMRLHRADSRRLDNHGPRANRASPARLMLLCTEKLRMPPWRCRSSGT